MPLTQQQIGVRVINARDSAHLNQMELAEKTGINKSVLNRIEKGSRPARDTELASIAKATDVSVDYLVGNSDKMHYYDLNDKDKRGIEEKAQELMDGVADGSLNYFKNGVGITEEDRQLLLASLRQVVETSTVLAKKKFTPKKYRDDHDDNENE